MDIIINFLIFFTAAVLAFFFIPSRKKQSEFHEEVDVNILDQREPMYGRIRATKLGRPGWYISNKWYDDVFDRAWLSENILNYKDCTDWESEGVPKMIDYSVTDVIENVSHTDSWNSMQVVENDVSSKVDINEDIRPLSPKEVSEYKGVSKEQLDESVKEAAKDAKVAEEEYKRNGLL